MPPTHQVSTGGAYDSKASYELLQKKGDKASITPRKIAGYWEEGHPQNEAAVTLKAGQLANWKKAITNCQKPRRRSSVISN